jgi:hypothetical protein
MNFSKTPYGDSGERYAGHTLREDLRPEKSIYVQPMHKGIEPLITGTIGVS